MSIELMNILHPVGEYAAPLTFQSRSFFNRRALVITDTELKLMAAAAMIGLSKMPNQG